MPKINEADWRSLWASRPCWYCKHNMVSMKCAACLEATVLFEKTDGATGKFKPDFEKGKHCMRL